LKIAFNPKVEDGVEDGAEGGAKDGAEDSAEERLAFRNGSQTPTSTGAVCN
jgi:hypothetical protein